MATVAYALLVLGVSATLAAPAPSGAPAPGSMSPGMLMAPSPSKTAASPPATRAEPPAFPPAVQPPPYAGPKAGLSPPRSIASAPGPAQPPPPPAVMETIAFDSSFPTKFANKSIILKVGDSLHLSAPQPVHIFNMSDPTNFSSCSFAGAASAVNITTPGGSVMVGPIMNAQVWYLAVNESIAGLPAAASGCAQGLQLKVDVQANPPPAPGKGAGALAVDVRGLFGFLVATLAAAFVLL